MNLVTLTAAFALGVATPIAAWRYSTDCHDCTDAEDVSLMADGTLPSGNGVWDGHLADPVERFFFYVRHPSAPRPKGKGDLWIMEQREKWTQPIRFNLADCQPGHWCQAQMPPNELDPQNRAAKAPRP